MDKQPILYKFPVYLKIITFGMIILSSMILILIFSVVLAVPFFGPDVMKNLSVMGESNDPELMAMAKYFQIVSQIGTFIIPTILFAFLDGRKIWTYLKLNIRPLLITSVFSILAIFAAVPLINFLSEWNAQMSLPASLKNVELWMREAEDQAAVVTANFLNVTTPGGILVNLLMIGVIPAIGEEFLFRGVLQKLFHQWTKNIHVSVILAAFLFSAIHMQFYGFIPRFMMGVMLGYVFVWSGSLWVPILIHFTNNSAAVVVSYLQGAGKADNTFDTVGTGDAAMLPILLSTIFTATCLFLIFYSEKKKRNRIAIPDN
jgi:uncharacterized protein